MRASLYNAMPIAGVQTLVSYMRQFAQRHGYKGCIADARAARRMS